MAQMRTHIHTDTDTHKEEEVIKYDTRKTYIMTRT